MRSIPAVQFGPGKPQILPLSDPCRTLTYIDTPLHIEPPRGLPLNRRRAARAPLSVGVRVRLSGQTVLAQSGDVSASGMLLGAVYDALYPRGQRCRLEFALPNQGNPLVAHGVILRQKRHRRYHIIVVRFSAIAPSHQRAIARYVAQPLLMAAAPAFLPTAE